ncbi:MAG: hypothetical protein H6956_08955 [Chromatiaceae bacterium]|nr:hypothetical protein [Chromatiaceae bacterium]MCP5435360.1 hypothetical protein [Chromatiaceae bacterium]MCW5584725.1 hypothetical protein [Chromatiales bacterium]HOP16451.1 hypothetical protein [Gammaproteobacteria bacterium]HPQ25473.1 hypothetical protein [Gammaproteobacteria bacterium]
MSNQDPPAGTTKLFPDAWIVGRAAATLVRDDEDVLLADEPAPADPVPVPLREVSTRPRAPLAPSAQELAELRAEMDRLQQRISLHQAARQRTQAQSATPFAGDLEVPGEWRQAAAGQADLRDRPSAPTVGGLVRNRRRLWVGLLLVLVVLLGAAVVGLLAYRQSTSMSPPLGERLQLLKHDVTQRVAGLGARLKALQGDAGGRLP